MLRLCTNIGVIRKMTNMQHRQRGFNLIELLVTMVILAAVAGVAVPSFISMLDRRAISAEANRIVRSINLTRSKAVNGGRQFNATMERTSATANDWSTGWRVFVDDDGNLATAYDAVNDQLLYDISVDTRAVSIISTVADRIMFNSQGRLVNGGTVYFSVCDAPPYSADIDGTLVTIRATGTPSTSTIAAADKAAECANPGP